jgi:hypothetical protein
MLNSGGFALGLQTVMTNRVTGFLLCAIPGVLLLACGLLVPAHIRAVDASVLREAGRSTPGLVQQGLALVRDNNPGAARLLLQAAQQENVPQRQNLGLAITNSAAQHPSWDVWGGGDTGLERLFASDVSMPRAASEPFTDFAVREENRTIILELLGTSLQPAVQELIRCRTLTNTVLFPPPQSASGQAFDTALGICGLLLDRGHLSHALNKEILRLAAESNRGGDSGGLEQVLMDLLSLGQRMNWGQLVEFVGEIRTPETLRLLADVLRNHERQLPVIFSAVRLSGDPARVATYAMSFGPAGLTDLGGSLRFGAGGVKELLLRNQLLHSTGLGGRLSASTPFDAVFAGASYVCWQMPRLGLAVKWLFYLGAGFLLAAGLHFARPAPQPLERPLQVRGFHVAREILFAMGFLLVVLLLSEPFLAQDTQKADFPLRLRLPTVGKLVPAGAPAVSHGTIMNRLSLLTLLLFFVLQALLYTACLFKLAEIRRQRIGPRVKLKLLENEDHLFDAGLYLGFAGTIVSLILVSLGVIQPSLMAAYSSTSFGIIFVSVFKIFNLRPVRRRLLLEAEANSPEPMAPGVAPTFASPS